MINNETFLITDVPEHSITFISANQPILKLSKDGIWANPDVPVDEIARKVFDTLEPMIITSYSSELYKKDVQLQTMKNQLERAERILAALREPSESIMHTAYLASFQHTLFDRAWAATLCAAVTAAEQEVGRE